MAMLTAVIFPGVQRTVQFTPLVLREELITWHSAVTIVSHYNEAFSFHQVSITAGYAKAVWNEKFV